MCGKIERVTSGLEAIDDAHILDHAITVLTHLATTLEANAQSQIGPPNSVTFLAVDHITPAEKNEKQLCFKRTTHSAGRKQKMVPLL